MEETASGVVGEIASEHFEDLLDGIESIEQIRQVGTRKGKRARRPGGWGQVTGMGSGEPVLTLQIGLSDLEIQGW